MELFCASQYFSFCPLKKRNNLNMLDLRAPAYFKTHKKRNPIHGNVA